tara:strand:+ start:2447 stop:2611 length:165 start_codon:yes stop_codon:yes gene_type:complete
MSLNTYTNIEENLVKNFGLVQGKIKFRRLVEQQQSMPFKLKSTTIAVRALLGLI